MAAGSAAVLTSFLTNLYICLACFGTFSVLRSRPWARRFFAARRYAKDIDLKPKRLPNGLLNWIIPVARYPESDIIDEAGLDAAMYLRILRFGVYWSFAMTIFCILMVLPPNLTSNAINTIIADQAASNTSFVVNGNDYSFTNFDRYSLSNVPSRSRKMWAHLVAVYGVVLFTLWLLWRFNRESVLLRLMFLGNSKRGGPSHTVLVTDIPGIAHAVARGLRDERRREMERARSTSGSKGVDVQADSSYVELGTGPAREPSSPAAVRRRPKSVTIQEPPGAAAAAGSESAGRSGQGIASNGQPAGDDPMMSAFPMPVSRPAGEERPGPSSGPSQQSRPGSPLAGSESGPPGKSGFSVSQLIADPRSDSTKYTLVTEVDPRYAATGGKLEAPRVGMTREEILAELEVVEPDNVIQALPASLGVDTRPLPPDRRTSKRFQYDKAGQAGLEPELEAKKHLKSGLTPQQLVAREFALVYSPGLVAAVNMVQDTSDLEPLANEFNKVAQLLEDYLEKAKLRLKLRKGLQPAQLTVIRALYGKWDYLSQFPGHFLVKVDAVEFWLARLGFLRERIREEQAIAARKVAPSAFVTFNTRMAQAVSSSSLLCHDETSWRVQTAPAPFEVVWRNIALPFTIKSGRMYILWAAFWAMTLFFMIPVTAIQALIEVPKLAKVPVLGAIVTAPAIRQIVEAILPGLALKIFLAIVPIILRIMALLSGATSESEIDFGVVRRYFLFQVIVVFLGSIVAGSFFNQLEQWVHDPSSVVPTLGKSIPMTSTFFITYLLVNGLSAKSFAFIRLPAFVIFWLLSRFAGSPRARQRLWTYQYTNNGTTVVDHTVALLLALTFSCINPIMCPVALVYFLVNFVGESYNNIYVFRREYESGGKLWQTVYNQVMVGLYVQQLTMLGLLLVKKFAFALLLIPLIIFCVGCHLTTLQLFKRPWSVTSLHDAAQMDMLEADTRRMGLLAAAKEERKKKLKERLKRAREEAARRAEAAGEDPPSQDPTLKEQLLPGKAETLLRESLAGDGFALNSEEKREIAEMYMNPAFKVRLDDVERLSRLAAQVQARLPRLNAWVAQYKAYRGTARRAAMVGVTDPADLALPPKMPEDLTIFDEDPHLQDSDEEDDGSALVPLKGAAAEAEAAAEEKAPGDTRV